MSNMRVKIGFVGLCLMALGFVGCYHLGEQPVPFQKIYIAPPTNASYAPRVQAVLLTQIREFLLKSKRVKLVDEAAADATLTLNITSYQRTVAAVNEKDPDIAKSLSLGLTVEYSLYNVREKKDFFKNKTVSETMSIVANTFTLAAEYQRMPELTRSVANTIVNTILSTW
jgi:hypothetical protein